LRGIIYHDRVFVVQLIFGALLDSFAPALNRAKCLIWPDNVKSTILFHFRDQYSNSIDPWRELPRKPGVQLI